MCEKPMAINGEEAQKMLDASRRTGKKLTIGYQNRYRPDSWYLKRACEAGELGEIYYAKAHALRRRGVPTWGGVIDEYEQGGGPLVDIGTHALDLTLWMMDNYKPRLVMGSGTASWAAKRRPAIPMGIGTRIRSRWKIPLSALS